MNDELAALRTGYQQTTYEPEAASIDRLLTADRRTPAQIAQAQQQASELIEACRANRSQRSLLDAFLDQFGLSTEEGVALMCLAESIVRIPDQETADALIVDKIGSGERWREHLGESDSMLVNASTWALMLTGEVVDLGRPVKGNFGGWLGGLVNRMGEPVIRQSLRYAMKLLGNEFVFATSAREAVASAEDGALYSFDMLGEAARTSADAEAYQQAYLRALDALKPNTPVTDCLNHSGISVKLSALYPRYETLHESAVHAHLYPKLLALAERAAADNLQLTIDAEEANRLDLSLDLLARLMAEPTLARWQGLGLALQAYGKRALPVIDYLAALARQHDRCLIVRLVKGAYWDTEIKHAQQLGLDAYPVFTTKPATDLSYIACAQRLLESPDAFYAQFATHNAFTLANILQLGQNQRFELQRLHGMGDLLYETAGEKIPGLPPVRTYAPVGPHKHLMAYLIRRLLENGANSSFVNRFLDDEVPVDRLVRNTRNLVIEQPTALPLPAELFGESRANSRGVELNDPLHGAAVASGIDAWAEHSWGDGDRAVRNPARPDDLVGHVTWDEGEAVSQYFAAAQAAQPSWDTLDAGRAAILRRAADLLEQHNDELLTLLIREAGKTWQDAVDEIREAVDFLRYYAQQCEAHFGQPQLLPGPTGERNTLRLHGRGVWACISPWNFPLAIFLGQVSAALAAGNAVLAKPAEQTPLIASRAVALLREAGVPQDVLQLVQGDGAVGAALIALPGLEGVAFTGSTQVAKLIARTLADKDGPIVPLIAETGGQNAMIVDSTAMFEQVTDDVIRSAFGSAGQRCSALRVLCLQDDIADELLPMIGGAMALLRVGDPLDGATDVGPIIDAEALARLQAHSIAFAAEEQHRTPLPEAGELAAGGHFFAPRLLEIDGISALSEEQFGPILHVVRYRASELNDLLADLSATGYGLTLGIHSRNTAFVDQVYAQTRAGNVYVNRNMTGAVVGVQPFGGTGLSGSGPKAGGPHYLLRFATERTLSDNVAAIGGNLDLLTEEQRAET
jgi:RHH-type proline utilization regulon transcriptional repressor/proline dehydrogenase/delta 1-pyrroline-5-carboxylate dehydrogenase